MRGYRWSWLLVMTLICSCSTNLFAQATATGTIQGTVSDKTQAVVPGAQVTATQIATGAKRSAVTDDTGAYRFDLAPAGTYTIRVAKDGFSGFVQTFDLLVGQTASVNVVLNPGAAAEVVEVTSVAPLVDMTKTSVSQSITPDEVQQLPIVGRDVADLAYLAPGVRQTDSYDPTKRRYSILSVNGQNGRNVNVTVNGVDNKDNTVGGPVMQLPLEAVQEFQISSQRFSAANGRSEGAAINLITKSGSNDIHGSLFGFFRDQALNAIDSAAAETGIKPPYSRQQFGGSVGAPILKDKFFGFFALERQREATSLSEDPTAYNELVLATPIGAEPAQIIPTPFFEWRYNGRLDYRVNDRHSAYLSYSSQDNSNENDQSDGLGDLTGANSDTNHIQVANLSVNSLFSNTLLNTFTFGFQYWNNLITSNIEKPYITFPSDAWFGTNTNVPQQSFQRKWQFRDDMIKNMRKHTFKWGVDYVYEPTLGGFFTSNHTLEIDFALDPSDIVALPNGFSTAGIVSSMSQSVGDPTFRAAGGVKQLGLYFQDDWKVSNRLTLNLGLRWDKDYNLIGGTSVTKSRTYQELKAINHPLAATLPEDDSKDFSPRVGFAYDLTGGGRHVLRGGFGLYYGQVFQNIPLFMQQQANDTVYQGVFSITAASGGIVPGTGIPLSNWRYGVDPFPPTPVASSDLLPGSTGRLMDPDYRNPYTEQFNAGYQWLFTPTSVLEVDYVHVLSLHENKTININPTINGVRPLSAAFQAAGVPVLGSVRMESSIGRSRYDGLNVSFRKRLTEAYQLTANYTLSRAYGYGAGGTSFRNYPRDPRNPLAKYEFGPSANDERHHLTLAGIVKLPARFQVAPIMQVGSARPYNVLQGYDVLGLGSGLLQGAVVPNSDPTDYKRFTTVNFATNSLAGQAARACLSAGDCMIVPFNSLRGDPFFQLDMRVSNNIKLGEKRNLELIFQAFNLTNKTNHGNNFNGTITSSSFMEPSGFINPTSSTLPRAFVGEFGFRFSF